MSNPIAAALDSTGFVKVWKSHGDPLNCTLYCRVNESDNPRWAQLAEVALRGELEANNRFRFVIARRWMIVRGNFGYTWQVSVWAEDDEALDEAAALFSRRGPPRPRGAPTELDSFSLPHRGASRNNPEGKLVRGARGKMVPSEKGAFGTPLD